NILTVESLGAFSFLKDELDENAREIGREVQPYGLKRDRASGFWIVCLIDCAGTGLRNLTDDLETPDFVGHFSLPQQRNRRSTCFRERNSTRSGRYKRRIT